MKKIFLIACISVLFSFEILAQSPGKFNYQAVIRDDGGELLVNQNVSIRVSIIDNSPAGSVLYQETHSVTSNAYGIVSLVIGDGTDESGDFSGINWGENDKYLGVEIDEGSGYVDMGTSQILSVPYSNYSNIADSSEVSGMAYSADYANEAYTANVLGSNAVYSPAADTLFVVKDTEGNVVFAVFPDGAQVIVNETAKGKVGGFAVSGRNPAKATDVEILRITQDSTRIYVNDTVSNKGKVGGFAVSGRNPAKNTSTDILFVTADSTRVYVNEDAGTKGKVGGFAVSGRNPAKGTLTSYMQVTPDSTRIFVKDSVAGFSVANIESGTSESFLNLNKQNYLIGHQTGENTTGAYNSMIGYQAGYSNTAGSNNLFFGYQSGYSNLGGGNNVYVGTESGYSTQNTFQNTFVGYRSGYSLTTASNSVFGSMAGENAGGSNNTFIGTSAGRIATGGNNTFIGEGAGYSFPNENTGTRNTYVGQAVGSFTSTGSYNTMLGFRAGYLNYEGSNNTFLGYYAGYDIHEGSGNVFIGYEAGKSQDGVSDQLFISNWDDTTPLIYGDFNLDRLAFYGNVGVNRTAYSSVSLAVSPGGQFYGIYVDAGSTSYAAYFNGNAYTTGTWGSSDIRWKKNIKTISEPIDIIKKIRGVTFNWDVEKFSNRGFNDGLQVGFIAQEVEQVLPELVQEDHEGYKAVAYDKFTAVLVEAIKEQQAIIEDLEKKNTELEERLKKLEEHILK